jgi:hypothetical protein
MGGAKMISPCSFGLALALGCFALAGACGNADQPLESELLVQQEPAPQPHQRSLSKLASAALEARGPGFELGNPQTAPAEFEALAQHFQLRGTARFVPHNPAAKPSLQDLEIALAGPQLQRYQLTSGDYKNWFMLGGSGDAWVKTPNDTQPRPFSSEAAILEEDASLRWLILRFPKDLVRGSEEIERTWSATWEADGLVLLQEDKEHGKLLLKFDEQGLPTKVYRALAEGSAEPQLLLEVSEWSVEVSGQDGVRSYPRQWVWHRDDWNVEERIDQIEDRALYLDVAFRPADAPVTSFRVHRGEDGSSRRIPRDRFALVQRSLHYQALTETAAAQGATDGRLIWKLWDGAELRYVLQVDEPSADIESVAIEDQLCLLWSSTQRKDHEQARERLVRAAAENALEVVGPLWFNTSVDGLEALLPVQRRD